MLEYLCLVAESLLGISIFGAILLSIVVVILLFNLFIAWEDNNRVTLTKHWSYKMLKYMIPGLVIAVLIILFVPTPGQLFKVRVELLKYHAVDQKNVTQFIGRVDELTKKLECKYLGDCPKNKPESK